MNEIYDIILGWKHRWFREELPKILAVFDKHDVDGMIKDDLRKKIEWSENRIKELESDNFMKRQQGVNYDDRKNLVEKITAGKSVISKWKSILTKPMNHPAVWLKEGDYQTIKRMGFRKFISLFYELAYD